MEPFGKTCTQRRQLLRRNSDILALNLADELDAGHEQPLAQGATERPVGGLGVLVEELEVLAEIEDQEVLLN
ncbi:MULTISPECIES: hypothetical protein [unclassified Thiocapsa]|uniref:hypothetical protein n=1 Tax=unclassified Thiocapsa TaxID=2641286 RepID=UPI0035B3BDA7